MEEKNGSKYSPFAICKIQIGNKENEMFVYVVSDPMFQLDLD